MWGKHLSVHLYIHILADFQAIGISFKLIYHIRTNYFIKQKIIICSEYPNNDLDILICLWSIKRSGDL